MEMKQWIRQARLHAGMTQEKLADALGVTKGNVSAWENGRHEPSLDQIKRIRDETGYADPFQEAFAPPPPKLQWPFPALSEEKLRALRGEDAARLEAVILLGAAQLGLDVKK